MRKTPTVRHESRQISPGAPSCDVYMPTDKGLAATRQQDGSFFIAPGLGSIKADYRRLAQDLASRGFTVYSPNCNEALPDSRSPGALDRRAETLVRSIEKWGEEGARILPHSLGAPVTIKALTEMGYMDRVEADKDRPAHTGDVLSVSFMQPAGFDRHGPADFLRAMRFYLGEALPRTGQLLPELARSPRGVYERLDIGQRSAEVSELWNLPQDFMVQGISAVHAGGLAMNFFLGPKDHLTRAEPIRTAVAPIVGHENVIDIHPDAGHLAAQTHPRHMANLIMGNLIAVGSGVPLAHAA